MGLKRVGPTFGIRAKKGRMTVFARFFFIKTLVRWVGLKVSLFFASKAKTVLNPFLIRPLVNLDVPSLFLNFPTPDQHFPLFHCK